MRVTGERPWLEEQELIQPCSEAAAFSELHPQRKPLYGADSHDGGVHEKAAMRTLPLSRL